MLFCSPGRRGQHVPHQRRDEQGSGHGPCPVHPVVVPVVGHQSWPEGSGRVHAGSGHAASARGTTRLRHPAGHEASTHPAPAQGRAQAGRCWGAAASPAHGSWLRLALLGLLSGRRHPGCIPAQLLCVWGHFPSRMPRAERLLCCSAGTSCSPAFALTVCELGKTQRGLEAPVSRLFGGLLGAGLFNKESSVTHVGSRAGQERQ